MEHFTSENQAIGDVPVRTNQKAGIKLLYNGLKQWMFFYI